MIEEFEVRQKLASVLRDEMSLDDFEDWLVQTSWNMHLDSSSAVQDLVSAIELNLSEYSSQHLTEAELYKEFSFLLSQIAVSVKLAADASVVDVPRSVTTAANSYQVLPAAVLLPV